MISHDKIDMKIFCNVCFDQLDYKEMEDGIYIIPCKTCLEHAEKKGYLEGTGRDDPDYCVGGVD